LLGESLRRRGGLSDMMPPNARKAGGIYWKLIFKVTGMAMGSGRPAGFPWNYDRSEIIADSVIHALGICSGLIGSVIIVVIASHSTKIVTITSVLIYAAGLVAMLGFSAAYNMWPVSPTKWVLRRFDHSAIYLLIAGTYTPFIAQLKNQLCLGRPAHGRLANGRLWCRVEACATRPFRSRSGCPLSTSPMAIPETRSISRNRRRAAPRDRAFIEDRFLRAAGELLA
jgi:hypothetical protein